MAGVIALVIVFVLCILLLLPVRVKASYGGGKWAVAVYYAFFRVFHKESKEPPPVEVPPKPEDITFFEPGAEETESKPEDAEQPESEGSAPEESPAGPAPADIAESASATEPEQAEEIPEQSAPESEEPDETAVASEPETENKKKSRKDRKQSKKKKETADEDADTDEEQEDGKKKKKKKGFIARLKPSSLSDVLGLVKDGFAALSPSLRFLGRHLHFRHVRIRIDVGSDDPANTAQLYGKLCAAGFNLLAQLQRLFDFQTDEFRILADFYGNKLDFSAALELRLSPAALILMVLILGIKFLWRTLCRFRREDKEAKRYEKESAPLPTAKTS